MADERRKRWLNLPKANSSSVGKIVCQKLPPRRFRFGVGGAGEIQMSCDGARS